MIERNTASRTDAQSLDERHAEIFRWIAELECAASDQRMLFSAYAITRLKKQARAHFAAEEGLMKAADYPNFAEHIAEHAEFSAKLDELQLKSGRLEISTGAVEFLKDWLDKHFAKTDRAYLPSKR